MNEAGPEQLCEAIALLRAGGIVAFPTETVYGLGADAFNPDAVRRVFKLKARPPGNPLIVHVSGVEMAREAAGEWPALAEALAEAFWPGPLTIVLPKQGRVPDAVTGGGPTVGVRAPDHHVALALIDALGGPLVGPSANRSGGVSPTTARHVEAEFHDPHVFVLDGGPCRVGIESTVVRIGGGRVEILRPGLLGAEEIARATGAEVTIGGTLEETEPAPSPGMLGPHYRPRTRTVLVAPEEVDTLLAGRERVCLVTTGDPPGGRAHAHVLLPPDAPGYARRLYAALREADASGADVIAVVRPGPGRRRAGDASIWEAVLERLSRAADARDGAEE